MRRHTLLSIVTTLALIAAPASVSLAQRTPPRLDDPADDLEDEEELPEDEEEWDEEEEEEWVDEEEPLDEEELDEEVLPGEGTPPIGDEGLDEPAPGDDQTLLDGAAPSSDPTRAAWTSPQSVLTLHGYLRVRGELMDNFFLDHRDTWPFSLWVPGGSGASVLGECRDGVPTCGNADRIRGANMRVRLQPTLALSDDVRVHMTLDVLDNVALGSSPDRVFNGTDVDPETGLPVGDPGSDMPEFGSGGVSSTSTGDAFRDSIYVRRAWAEVTNRALGQLRFGRMAHEWGLGMLYNAGDKLDDDYSSEIDRIQAITRYSNIFFGASYDFAGEGVIMSPITRLRVVPFDFTGADDIRQFSFMAAYRLSEEEQEERLANGDWVLNAGIYFLYRTQRLDSSVVETPVAGEPLVDLVRRNARQATPDVWAQFLWGDLRLELEAALHVGRVGNITNDIDEDDDYRIISFGFAFQGEYRLLDDALGIYVDTGLGTGDSQARGISGRENTWRQEDDNRQLTHFGFHPNYRIDLILFRNILGNVGGVYYLRPGLSYDIVRTAFGQRLGARVDFIYSRANRTSQIREYGDRGANTLGLELDASVYYRSEDGPGLTDGFYAAFHYGILFPMAGLKESGLSVGNAQVLRLVLGVEY